MQKKYFFKINIFLLLSLLVGCRRDLNDIKTYNSPKNFNQIFQSFWTQMNNNYLYWDLDATNWDKVYTVYTPLFEKLDIQNNIDINTSYKYFEEMTENLLDAHFSLSFDIPNLNGRYIYPALNKKLLSKNFHSANNYITVDTNYLNLGFKTGFFVTNDNKRLQVISGIIKTNILYLNCNLFALKESYYSKTNNNAQETLQYFLNLLHHDLKKNITGVIIDVRNNPGGNVEDLNFLVGQFIDKPLPFGFTRFKNGNGRLNYTPWINVKVLPQVEGEVVNKRVVILVDNFTISLGEAVAMAMHCIPNTYIVGETTWGATGPIINNGIYNDGGFNIPGFCDVYTSSAAFKYIDEKIYEGIGFPPDFPISVNPNILSKGQDEMLNKAISLLP